MTTFRRCTQTHEGMRVLGIDPGFDRLGLAVIEGDPSKPTLVWSTCVETKKGEAAGRLAEVFRAVSDAVEAHKPDGAAIETLFFSTNRKTAMAVAESRGVVLAALGSKMVPVFEYSPQQVKMAVTGYGAASKEAVISMIPRLMVLPPRKRLDDELDAIAVAAACLPAIHTKIRTNLQT